MAGRSKSYSFGIGMALLSVAIAAALRAALTSIVGLGVPFVTFFPAVMAASLLGGALAGAVATVFSALVALVWFMAPVGVFKVDLVGGVSLGLFVAVCTFIIWLCERVRRAGSDADSAAQAQVRIAAIVESSDDSIVSKGLDGVIQSWNLAAARLFGYDADEIVGRSIGKLVPADLLNEQADLVDRLRSGERIEPFETIRLHKSGTPVRVQVAMSPLKARDGRVIGAVEIARDTGQRLQTEATLRKVTADAQQHIAQLRAVLDSMSEGVVLADAEGNLLEWTRSALIAHGYQSVDQVRAHLSTFPERFELSDRGRKLPIEEWPLSRVLRGESFRDFELSVRRLDEPRDLIINYGGRPVHDAQGRLVMAVLTLHDVTEERRAQRGLLDNAERLSLAMDAAGLGDWAWDVASNSVRLSPTAAVLFGISADQAFDREFLRGFLDAEDCERGRRIAADAMASHSDYSIEYRVHRADGQVIWVAVKGRGQYDGDGQLVRMLGVMQDITARKLADQALRENREWLELAVSIAQMGTFRLDLKASELAINLAGRTIYGLDADEPLLFDSVRRLIFPDDLPMLSFRVQESMKPGNLGQFETEFRITRTDGVIRWVQMRGRSLFTDAQPGQPATLCVGTFLDVTEEREARQQREQLLRAEQVARAQAEHAGQMKDEFLATLSHELRTPLNAILGWSQILGAVESGDADFRQGMEVIERNARAQAQIIEDLLDMSRIISGKVRLDVKAVDLDALLATAADTVRPTADAKGVRLSIVTRGTSTGVAITADPHRLQQVLWNLLTNAVKFTPRGGEVTLSLTDGDGCVHLTVADTGEGIRADFVPHVFDRFRQADASTTRRHGGLGLGLAIVKQLSELHGGTVQCESAGPGQGATFTVVLPLCAPQSMPDDADGHATTAAQARSVLSSTVSLNGLHVLVVDDEPDARNLAKRLLEDRQAKVTLAGSAEEAMQALTNGQPLDVMVSDIGMPGEDGYGLISRVRIAGSALPAVALTAYARNEDRERVIAAGFQTHLAKPLDPAALIATVARLAGR